MELLFRFDFLLIRGEESVETQSCSEGVTVYQTLH